jgi:hypothetical protein
MRTMTLDQIRRAAPSVFSTKPYAAMSEKYRFFDTSQVVEGLMHEGFLPVRAQQSRTRIEGKEAYTKHLLRFRHASMADSAVQSTVPEIVLINSHDGSSAYHLSLGLYRVICTNGLVVKSAGIEDIRVRHSGRESLIQEVIEASYRVIDEAPKALAQVEQWQHLQLSPPEQEVLAEAALELRDSTLEVQPRALLAPRRWEDGDPHRERDVWRTMNTVQEVRRESGM